MSATKKPQRKQKAVSLGDGIAEFLGTLPSSKGGLWVHWSRIAAPHLLEHTDNVVYNTSTKDDSILVYVDSPAYAAELSGDKELYRLRLEQETGKSIGDVSFLVSRKSAYRKRR